MRLPNHLGPPVLFILAIAASLVVGRIANGQTSTEVPVGTETALKEFERWSREYVAKPHADLLLPKDWFFKQFQDETAKKLSAEYRQVAQQMSGIPAVIKAQQAKGQTVIQVGRFDKAIDKNATGLQNAALQQMKTPVPLFTLRLVKPGESRGFSLASFVKVDGEFLLAGKMSAFNTRPDDMVTTILCNTPLASMEKLLQEKGLLSQSAVDHLKEVGVLK